jgi:hypothetical protein
MKRRNHFYLLRWIALGIIVAIVSLSTAGFIIPALVPALAADSAVSRSSQADAKGKLDGLVGSWKVSVTVVKQDATFPGLLTFTSDGIVLADEPPSPFETTGHGAWEATGKDSADFTFVALIGSESGTLSATVKVMGSLVYDAGTDTWQGPFTIRITDADGAEVLADDGTFDATRIVVEAPSAAAQGPSASPATLKPGDKIGEMTVVQGPVPFDLNITHYGAYCNANPMMEPGSTVAKPGVYTVECSVPPLPNMFIAFGLTADTAEQLNEIWSASSSELYVNDKLVDQAAFGALDADVPVAGVPGQDPNEVLTVKARVWNVILENLTPGQFTMRLVWHASREVFDGAITSPAGDYDLTYKITVDPSLAAGGGAPAPVELVQQSTAVFDTFNAAVNAHDVEKALSFFADDAVASFPGQPPPNVNKGLDEIRTWLEDDIANNIHVEIENSNASGDTVKATAKVQVDSLPPDLTLVGTVEVTVKDGKITSFTYTLDAETLAKLAELEGK